MNIRKVKLAQIKKLEEPFREEKRDEMLELDISRYGLTSPLVVEQVSEKSYVLVEGYRRYNALDYIGKNEALCIVEEVTSPDERIIKRLKTEFHTKKRTPYELERMINHLLAIKPYKVTELSESCSVTVETITKYIKGKNVNPEWVKTGEEKNLGRHVITDIHYLKNIKYQTKEYIFELYKEGQITGNAVKAIDTFTKIPGFKLLREVTKKECIDEVVQSGIRDRDRDKLEEIISSKKMNTNFDAESHKSIYKLLLKYIDKINNILRNTIFVNHLSLSQRQYLINYFEGFIILLDDPEEESEGQTDGVPPNLEH
ncbi:ParB N-terminal domain-containing protein [Aquibacillus koreensis]|uniref:ParB N-terminal domain-containing protein n=1 Tax=Aquibacillus koreensis TaxID=279446 RepID=A0A9X3WJ80_9BACI|nr:ParB N-terminal domain-containing protein [Aquibacillus koreensis]MCT2534791.1 ParB N-terminal domain-containing protein [Aquibacillus koreensis]MDC3419598.1 ParB N-terminal domain-containing protein [Aquibacillus koreensis]